MLWGEVLVMPLRLALLRGVLGCRRVLWRGGVVEMAPGSEVPWGKMRGQSSGKAVSEGAGACRRMVLGFWGASGMLVLSLRLWGCR